MNSDRLCCDMMNRQMAEKCERQIVYNTKFDEFGLPIRDGGSSVLLVQFCPWCGIDLPDTKRELWFETLKTLGFDDPFEQTIPKKFNSDQWWRERD